MTEPVDSPGYRSAVAELLGLLACGELAAFSRLAADAETAPSFGVRAGMAGLAVREYEHFRLLADELTTRGVDPETAMAGFSAHFDTFNERTRPSTWLEGVVKAYVGEGIAADFYREIAAYVDDPTRALVERALDDQERTDYLVRIAREAMAADPGTSGRLALWARRLLGEALTQAQAVAVERDGLTALLAGTYGGAGADLAEMGRMFARLTDAHVARMERLGLTA
ncbi:MAG: ferritin-like fold-containing protein [Dermatophilaceae bacterium]